VSNTRAQALYRRFGFAPVGMRKGYYADADEDAIVMWVHDIDEAQFATRMSSIEADIFGETEWSEP
jgi:ribosomal-protein-alanine N-acetyltransferase